MRSYKSSAILVLLAVFALLLATAPRSAARPSAPGRLVVKHSPVLGINVAVEVTIDGRHAGVFTKGHTFVRYLSPGRHVISVARNGRLWGSYTRMLHVRPGRTYAFVAKHRVNEMYLQPVGRLP